MPCNYCNHEGCSKYPRCKIRFCLCLQKIQVQDSLAAFVSWARLYWPCCLPLLLLCLLLRKTECLRELSLAHHRLSNSKSNYHKNTVTTGCRLLPLSSPGKSPFVRGILMKSYCFSDVCLMRCLLINAVDVKLQRCLLMCCQVPPKLC